MKTVGIIGGSGFIGSYITKKFLEEGYRVNASVTDLKNRQKYEHLFKMENADNLAISELRVDGEQPLGKATQTYNGAQASRDLVIAFVPAIVPLQEYSPNNQ